MQDRFIKIMLTLVAVLLAANFVQSYLTSPASPTELFIGNASAQTRTVHTNPVSQRLEEGYTVKAVKGFPVEDLKEVVPLGDGMSFIATNSKGFMVYQVLPGR